MKALVKCWDGIEYYRETDDEEIAKINDDGVLTIENDCPVFDFRT